jgi:hypothetical protein
MGNKAGPCPGSFKSSTPSFSISFDDGFGEQSLMSHWLSQIHEKKGRMGAARLEYWKTGLGLDRMVGPIGEGPAHHPLGKNLDLARELPPLTGIIFRFFVVPPGKIAPDHARALVIFHGLCYS